MEKFATEARAVTVFAKMASSSSLKDRIINFPIFPHLLIFARIIYNHLFDLALYISPLLYLTSMSFFSSGKIGVGVSVPFMF